MIEVLSVNVDMRLKIVSLIMRTRLPMCVLSIKFGLRLVLQMVMRLYRKPQHVL